MLLNNAQAIACRDAMMALNNVNGYFQANFINAKDGTITSVDGQRDGSVDVALHMLSKAANIVVLSKEKYDDQYDFCNGYSIGG